MNGFSLFKRLKLAKLLADNNKLIYSMITLRAFKQHDTCQIVTILNDHQVARYLSSKIPFPYTQADAQWWINHGSKFGIIKAIEVDGLCVGCIGVTPGEFEYSRNGEIGYWLSQQYWGQGIITQAIKLICKEAFDSSELNRIFATVFSVNIGSIKALTKAEFSLEAQLKQAIYKNNQFYDAIILSLLKNHQPNLN
jgi:RimJ/RimL family protein N-acetyltransferase